MRLQPSLPLLRPTRCAALDAQLRLLPWLFCDAPAHQTHTLTPRRRPFRSDFKPLPEECADAVAVLAYAALRLSDRQNRHGWVRALEALLDHPCAPLDAAAHCLAGKPRRRAQPYPPRVHTRTHTHTYAHTHSLTHMRAFCCVLCCIFRLYCFFVVLVCESVYLCLRLYVFCTTFHCVRLHLCSFDCAHSSSHRTHLCSPSSMHFLSFSIKHFSPKNLTPLFALRFPASRPAHPPPLLTLLPSILLPPPLPLATPAFHVLAAQLPSLASAGAEHAHERACLARVLRLALGAVSRSPGPNTRASKQAAQGTASPSHRQLLFQHGHRALVSSSKRTHVENTRREHTPPLLHSLHASIGHASFVCVQSPTPTRTTLFQHSNHHHHHPVPPSAWAKLLCATAGVLNQKGDGDAALEV